MRTGFRHRKVIFVVQDACLERTVTGADGRRYSHRCAQKVFETVACALSEIPREGEGTSLAAISRQEKLPFTQVNVTLEFLKERGIVAVRHRRSYPATDDLYLDAMTEFHALAHAHAEHLASSVGVHNV